MARQCPNCNEPVIEVSEILFGVARCKACNGLVGVHRAASWISTIVVSIVTTLTTVMVLLQSGMYAAIVWFPFPIGALNFLKARFSPLQLKSVDNRSQEPKTKIV